MLGCLLHAPSGPFYSPKAARSRWRPTRKAILALCRVVHRTATVHVRCAISFLFWRRRPLQRRVSWRTGHCPVPHADRWRRPRVARGLRGQPLRWQPLAHRTVRCTTGQSDAPPDSPVHYSRTPPNFPESGLFTGVQPGAPDTVRCTTGQSDVLDRVEIWLHRVKSFGSFLFSISST
jgi:hypothetical protein